MKYAGMRAASNVLLRDVNVALIIEEMYRGANVIYADFTDYDELAHHCGPERVESFEALDGVDAAIATLVKATDEAPRPYKFIVLSDHGQSLGETFLQRYGVSLGEFVRSLMSGRATVYESKTKAEGSVFVNSFLSEITQSKGVGPTVARAALKSKTTDGVVDLDADEDIPSPSPTQSSIAVVGSGNLGLVWFTGNDHRLTVEELEEKHPGLVAAVAAHPGVGLLLVRSQHVRRGRLRTERHALPRRGPRRGRGPDDAVRAAHDHEPQARGRDGARAGPAAAQPVRPEPRRGRRLRGADRLARRPRWAADRAVHPPPGRVDARRGGPARRTGHLSQHPALAERHRHRAWEAAGRRRGSRRPSRPPRRNRRPSPASRGQDPLRGRRPGLGRAVHRGADRFRATPAGAVAGSRHEVLRAPRARRHVGRRDRGDRHPRRCLGARALRLVGTGRRPADAPGGRRLRARDGDPLPGHAQRPDGGCHVAVDFQRTARRCAAASSGSS